MDLVKGIKSWSVDDRPREKLAIKGVSALSDAELIAILLGSGSREESAVELSRKILKSVNNDLVALGRLDLTELCRFKGMGTVKSITVIAAMELARRRRAGEAAKPEEAMTSQLAYELFLQRLDNLRHEEFWMMALNRRMQVLGLRRISEGGLTATVVDVKKIFRAAIEFNAACIIVAHNHPSGNTQPSKEDDMITKKIKEASKLMDCTMCDHLVISDRGYFSYADDGKLSLL